MNIPIFRAKKIDSDKDVVGDLFLGKFIIPTSILSKKILDAIKHIEEDVLCCNINEDCKNEHIELKNMLTKLHYNEKLEHITEIDPTTLAIHFLDMQDSQGNKIFASLSKDGKGGDIIEWTIFPSDTQQQRIKGTPYYSGLSVFQITNRIEMMWHSLVPHRKSKVIGIQE